MTLTAAQAVDAGIEFLNELEPGWFNKINLVIFDIRHLQNCVIGQLDSNGYWGGYDKYGLTPETARTLGFNMVQFQADLLNRAWVRRIRELQDAARTAEPKPEPLIFTLDIGIADTITGLTWEQVTALVQSMPDMAITITRPGK